MTERRGLRAVCERFAFAKSVLARHFPTMNTVEEIRTALGRLSLEERAEIAAELCGWSDDDWDPR